MHQNGHIPNTANAITRYFNKATLPNQQETLGKIVVEILSEGKSLSRKAICDKLLRRVEQACGTEEERHYYTLIGLLFDR
ncbi:two-component-system connector protein YcgZ [Pectobacterium betavasculorum]|uniref:Two-component-system connector protein YcgZ n=1 Tax=Pectobacterium betavasculorum TaxID=55207 RepID=A0A093T3T5_9GAMM|nr:regulatory protein YcgZ [Pectobacterium betavasculorum]KFX07526.1 two-component-system connector protein YcgZ [Pectobacterium betavasculorum]KFX22170.1 two-component-system connector protein YcgZ [Pectobacterium betavasculorum]